MDKITLRKIFKQPFANEHWNRLLVEVFHASDVYKTPQQFTFDNENAKYVGYFNGHVETPTGDAVGLFSYSSSLQVSRKKVSLRNLVAKIINPKYGSFDAAIVAYYDEKEWRISYICDLKNSSTSAKRFSFLVGDPNSEHNTAVNRLCEIKKDYELSDLFNAFSVERLTKEFFNEYTAIYKEFCDRAIDPKYFDFDGLDKKKIRDYVKLLLGRILFLCFVQKKGWMNGDKHFLRNIFDAYCNQIKTGEEFRFLDYVLEKIFFECLNKNHSGLYQTIVLEYGNNGKIDVPFLNGGLFECKELDIPRSVFGKELWLNLFNLLGSYNFTIDENDPTDAEIGIDPEMLGKIFESQLEDNKDKGAFYTPKEIVSYMCKESLIAYLEKSGVDKEELRTFVKHHELCDTWNDITKNNVLVLLKNIKVCDPAIGSGAFPMGMLREILYCRLAIESSENIAEIKREIIQNCIYGVDIEAGAVDIARLRFWLSIVVDSDKPEPLPNLDYKIMQGNSLLESYDGEMLDNLLTGVYSGSNTSQNGSVQVQMAMDFGDESNYRIELKRLLNDYFTTSSDEKKKLQDKIQNIVKKILITRRTKLSIDGKLEKIDIHSNSDFFLWHTWFADVFENGGFDVMIGNPPYISAPTQLANEQLKKQRKNIIALRQFQSLFQKWDLYIPFIELGIQFTKDNGTTTMIVPYPLTNQLYAKELRRIITKNFDMTQIVDLNGTKVFENATVSNCIPFISKRPTSGKSWVCNIDENKNIHQTFLQSHCDLLQDEKNFVWNLTQEKRNTNRHDGMYVFGDYCYVSYGLRPNSDEKKAKGEFKKEDLISEFQDDIPRRKYIEAKDIDRYKINKIRFLEYGTDRSPAKLVRPTFKEWFDISKLYFNRLGILVGTFDYDNKYLHNDSIIGAALWKDLNGVENKSITSSIKKFSTMSRFEMEQLSESVDLRFLLGIMNSKYASVLLTNLRGGDYHIYPEHIRNIPIPTATVEQQSVIIVLVEKILNTKRINPAADTSMIESEIDAEVYRLYGLSDDEIKIVEGR